MVATRLHIRIATILGFVSLAACSNATLSGSSSTPATKPTVASPASGGSVSADAAPNPKADAAANGTPQSNAAEPLDVTNAASNGGGSVDAASGLGPLTVTKVIGGIPLEDKPITFTIGDASGSGTTQTLTFNAGASGAKQLPNLCNTDGTPTTITVSTSTGGGIPGIDAPSAPTITGSSISVDPTTCIISEILTQGQGDNFTFTCPNNGKVILSTPASSAK